MSENTNGPDRPDSSGVDESSGSLLDNPQIYDLFKSMIQKEVDAAVHQQIVDEPSRNFLDNPQIYDLFKSTIQKEAREVVHQESEGARNRVFRFWTIVAPIMLAFIAAVPAISWNWINHHIKTVSKNAVEEKVDKVAKNARFEAQVATLNLEVLRIEIAEAFSRDIAESIINRTGALYAERDDAESRDKLIFAVESAARSFTLVDRPDLVIRLEEAASEVFHSSKGVLEIMIQAQGRRLLGDAGAPESWLNETGSMRAEYESYRFYADKGRNEGYPDYYTAYELLLGHLEGRPREDLKNLIADAENLDEHDQIHFLTIMNILATGEWTQRPNAESERVTRNVGTFLCEFRQESWIIEIIYADTELRCP